MIERFKRYLEREFRAIKPTVAAMEYREQVLTQLLEKEQDLRIKGMSDGDLIYDMCIDSLGDFRQTLIDFETKKTEVQDKKRKSALALAIAAGYVLLVTGIFILVSYLTGAWAKTWLIEVGGLFAGIVGALGFVAVKKGIAKQFVLVRVITAISIVLISVFAFLAVGMLGDLWHPAWLTFLFMIMVVLCEDTMFGFFVDGKKAFIELGIAMPAVLSLLYVALGILVPGFWHPGWLLCVAGALADVAMIGALIGINNKKKTAEETKKIKVREMDENEDYYTEWKVRK